MPLDAHSYDDDLPPVAAGAEEHVSTMKTRIEPARVLSYLQTEVDPSIAKVEFLAGGEFSQAFSFERGGEEFVIRVNMRDDGFKKDAYAAAHFASTNVPIPEIVSMGKLDDKLFTCITRKAPGTTFEHFDAKQMEAVMPRFLETIDAIHATPIPPGGFGYLDANGNAPHASWAEALLATEHDPYFDWEKLFDTTCMEREVYEYLMDDLRRSAPDLPKERVLLHGDLDVNTLTDGKEITAVIDWEGMRYGDPVSDIAWIQMWRPESPIAELYRQRVEASGKTLERYDGRMRCYTGAIGLGSLGFYAKSNQPTKYAWLKERLKQMGIL